MILINAFQKCLDESNCKPNKIWVHKGSEFYNRSMKYMFQDNDIEMYSAYNKRKSVFVFSIKKLYIDKLDKIVNKHNNTYHRTIKFKHVNVNSSTHIDFIKENNKENPKFEFGDYVRISKY